MTTPDATQFLPYKPLLWYIQHRLDASSARNEAKTGLCVSTAQGVVARRALFGYGNYAK